MKPQSNKKISHYNTGQPWIEVNKTAKPKPVAIDVDNPYTPATVTDTSGFYYAYLHPGVVSVWADVGDPWDEKQKQPETISIYTAREIPNEDELKYVPDAILKFDAKMWVLTEKKIEKKPKPQTASAWSLNYSGYIPCESAFRLAQRSLPDRCKDFLKAPVEVENPSGLILPDSLIEEKRQLKQLERMVAFVSGEIETVTKQYERKIGQMNFSYRSLQEDYVSLHAQASAYSDELDRANKELEKLRGVQATIAARSVDMTERTRHFRDEE